MVSNSEIIQPTYSLIRGLRQLRPGRSSNLELVEMPTLQEMRHEIPLVLIHHRNRSRFERTLPVRFGGGNQLDVIDEILNTRNIPPCSLGWERQLGGGIAAKSDNTVFHAYKNRSKAKAAKSANAISDQILDLLAQFLVRNIWT